MYSEILGQTVRYSGYFPPGYAPGSRPCPVLYHLHGGGPGRDTDLTGPSRIPRLMDRLIAEKSVPPMIIISPDARRDEEARHATFYMNDLEGVFRWKDMFFQEFIPYIEGRYRIVKRPDTVGTAGMAGAGDSLRAVSGISMGGFGALGYGLQRPGFFAAAAALSPSLRSADELAEMSPLEYERRYGKVLGTDFTGTERSAATQYPQACPLCLAEAGDGGAFAKTRFFFSCGAEDGFVAGSSRLHGIFQKKQVPHEYRVQPGDHSWTYWRSELPGMFRFISQAFADALKK